MTSGVHLSAAAVAYAWIVFVGVARMTKIVAPLAFSFAICEATLGRGDLERLLVDDVRRLAAEARLEAGDVVLAVVVVLVEDADLGVRAVAGDRLAVELALELVGRLPAGRPGVLSSSPRPTSSRPVETSICGTFFEFRYGRIARFTSVPSEPTTAKTLSCSTS